MHAALGAGGTPCPPIFSEGGCCDKLKANQSLVTKRTHRASATVKIGQKPPGQARTDRVTLRVANNHRARRLNSWDCILAGGLSGPPALAACVVAAGAWLQIIRASGLTTILRLRFVIWSIPVATKLGVKGDFVGGYSSITALGGPSRLGTQRGAGASIPSLCCHLRHWTLNSLLSASAEDRGRARL